MAKTKIPTTPEEAFAFLDAELTADEKKLLLQANDSIDFHFSLGLWIRNNWVYPSKGVDYPFFFGEGEDNWCMNPDDFSDELIKRYILHLKKQN